MRHLSIILCFWLTTVVALCADAPVRIAILAGDGDRAPKAGLVDLLVVQLSQQEGVVLLERQDVDRLLREHGMSAKAGTLTPKQAMAMGRVLAADCMLFVEAKREGRRASLHRFRYVEARTGIVLSDLLMDVERADDAKDTLLHTLNEASAKLAQAQAERVYIALLGYGAERAGYEQDLSPTALEMLVAEALGRVPNIVVLDREHLAALQDEEFLVGEARNYAISAYHVEGLIRGGAGPAGSVEIQTTVKPVAGVAYPAIRTPWQPAHEGRPWRQIAEAILAQIDTGAAPGASVDRATEAKDLDEHALLLKRYGEEARALAACEAAYVLDPGPARAIEVARGLRATVGEYSPGQDGEEARKQHDLRTLIRAFRLWEAFMQDRIANAGVETAKVRKFPIMTGSVHHLGELWRALRSENTETRELYEQLRVMKLKARDAEITYCRLLWPAQPYANRMPDSAGYFCSVWHRETYDIDAMSVTTAERVATVRSVFEAATSMPGYTSDYLVSEVLMRFQRMIPRKPPADDAEADREALLALSRWMQSHPREVVRIWGDYYETYIRYTFDGEGYDVPVFRLLDRLDAYLCTRRPDQLLNDMAHRCLGVTWHAGRFPEGAERYFGTIVNRLDGRTLASWYNWDSDRWDRWLRKSGTEFHVSWLQKAIAKLPSRSLARYRGQGIQASIESAHSRLERELSLFSDTHAAPEVDETNTRYWNTYRIENVPLEDGYTSGHHLALLKRTGDRLLTVWTELQDGSLDVRVRMFDLQGDVVWDSVPLLHPVKNGVSIVVTDADAGVGHAYVAIRGLGLLVASWTSASLLGQAEGLASERLSALALTADRLVIGYEADYLQVLNTGDRTVAEFAYSRSPLRRNALDGCMQRFAVTALLTDALTSRVWMTTRKPDATWLMDPTAGTLEQVAGRARGALSWNEGRIHCSGGHNLSEFDPKLRRWNSIRMCGQVFVTSSPHLAMTRDVLSAGAASGPRRAGVSSNGSGVSFSGPGGLYLNKAHLDKAIRHPNMVTVDFMVRTGPHAAMLGSYYGTLWRLTDLGTVFPEEQDHAAALAGKHVQPRSQTNRIAVASVTASSHVAGDAASCFEAAQAVDGDPTTCWAAATDDLRSARLTFSFAGPTRLSCLQLRNGWVPSPQRRTLYPVNHRVKSLSLSTDAGERTTFQVEDHNDPQFIMLKLEKPSATVTLTVTEIHEAEVYNHKDPPWLTLSEVTFLTVTPHQEDAGDAGPASSRTAQIRGME